MSARGERPVTRPAGLWIGTNRGGLHPLRHGDGWSTGTPYPDAVNVSFGVHSPRHDLHYLVDERDDGAIGVYRATADGWRQIARVAVDGNAPCHLALSHDQSLLAVANYASGSVSVVNLDSHGLPIAPTHVFAHKGSGPNRERQASPHAHWVGFDAEDRWLYATDLGTDEIRAFSVAPSPGGNRVRAAGTAFHAPAGSGPRHLLLHPQVQRVAYLASELANTLTVLVGGEGRFSATRTMSTLPEEYEGPSIVAHLAINTAGDRLYVSNRGHDSIAVFALDAKGDPRLVQHAPAGAAYPRHFVLLEDESLMVIANEKDECVTLLPIDADGLLGPHVARVAVPGAAFVLPL